MHVHVHVRMKLVWAASLKLFCLCDKQKSVHAKLAALTINFAKPGLSPFTTLQARVIHT